MAEQEGIDQVGAGSYELKVVAIGHLSCDDSGSVACEQHLIVPGHDRHMRQDETTEKTGGEGEEEGNRDQPAKLSSNRRLASGAVVMGGRCCGRFRHTFSARWSRSQLRQLPRWLVYSRGDRLMTRMTKKLHSADNLATP
jgi:hypothetical protein